MYHRERRKMTVLFLSCLFTITICKSIDNTESPSLNSLGETLDNNIIDFDEDYSIKFNKKYGAVPWESTEKFDREIHKYTLLKDKNDTEVIVDVQNNTYATKIVQETTPPNDYSVIPLELLSTTEDYLASIVDSTTEQDLTVIPLPTTRKIPIVEIEQTVTLPTSTQTSETTTEILLNDKILEESIESETTTIKREVVSNKSVDLNTEISNSTVKEEGIIKITEELPKPKVDSADDVNKEILNTNSSKVIETVHSDSAESNEDLPSFSELDASDQSDVPEDYYDNKDVVPTTAPKTDALSVIFGLAGSVVESVVESVAERVVPKSIYDLFKRMQRQNEALEAERLRSREENGGLGQFGRGILKSISSGLSKPLSQLMQGVRDIGSLDTDRGFVSSVASGVTSVANVATSVADAFKDRVQAIYPGTVWCGDGHSATARSSDLGLFFFTDTCCRQHDACKIYIQAGETKYGLTNTGLFTRSHCSCDQKFRDCLRKTNSLVSAQIGLTYFNVLGPQCFRKAHPIVKCVKRTRLTGQKCEEYELDYTKPKMWQWFDNETF